MAVAFSGRMWGEVCVAGCLLCKGTNGYTYKRTQQKQPTAFLMNVLASGRSCDLMLSCTCWCALGVARPAGFCCLVAGTLLLLLLHTCTFGFWAVAVVGTGAFCAIHACPSSHGGKHLPHCLLDTRAVQKESSTQRYQRRKQQPCWRAHGIALLSE